MVVSVDINNVKVEQTLIVQGNNADIMYWDVFIQLDIPQSKLQLYDGTLIGLNGAKVALRIWRRQLIAFIQMFVIQKISSCKI